MLKVEQWLVFSGRDMKYVTRRVESRGVDQHVWRVGIIVSYTLQLLLVLITRLTCKSPPVYSFRTTPKSRSDSEE
jgi:hypothetical protein